jgi:hypothetical protein
MRKEYESEILTASRARKYGQHHLARAESVRLSANEYSAFFKLRTRIKPADVASIAKRAAIQAKKALAATRKRERAQALKFAEQSAKWRKGENVRLPYVYNLPAILRLIEDGKTVETSQGARFPAEHARRAIPLVKRCHDKVQAWFQNGDKIRLGMYRLDTISDTGNVKAGCHRVNYSEVQHLATLLEC